jgi:Tol biopolymer transport system component
VYADGQDGAYRASITADGITVVMEQHVGREWLIWRKNLGTGEQQLLGRVMSSENVNPTIAADGTHVAYTVVPGPNGGDGYVLDTAGGTPRQVCEQCVLYGFLHDGRHVLAQTGQHALRVYGLDGSFKDLITVDSGVLTRPHASPDDRWLAFRHGRAEGGKSYVVPLTPGQPPPMSQWHVVDEPTITGRPAGWSLDGRLLYLLLETDGFRCLWAQRIDPGTGVPVGTPSPAYHFHGSQVATGGGVSTTFGNGVSAAGFIYETVDTRSDLWQLTRSPLAQSPITH